MGTDFDGTDLSLSAGNVRSCIHDVADRVSGDAVKRMAYQEEQRIKKKTRAAKVVANHAGRETVREEDIRVVESIIEEFGDVHE
jgi:histone H3/H4